MRGKFKVAQLLRRITQRRQEAEISARIAARFAIGPLRVVLGASGIADPGWIATEYRTHDITQSEHWGRLFQENTIDAILAEHVWEHLTQEEGKTALALCYSYLRPGGYLRIAVPDGLNPDKGYIDYVKPGGYGAGAEDHKVLYSFDILGPMGEAEGFQVEKLEYWDHDKQFKYVDWEPALGKIRRSRRYDSRNSSGKLAYTSLILDFIKPHSEPNV